MESETNFNENIASQLKVFLENPYEPKLADGLSMESSLSNRLNPKFPNCDQFTIQGSSSNPIFGVPNHLFNDPFDPAKSSSDTTYFLKDFISYASRQASPGDGANGLMHGSDYKEVLNFPPKSLDRSMDQVEIDKPLNFPKFKSLKINSPSDEDSCLTVNGGSEKKVVSKKKRAVVINRKNEDQKKSIIIKGQWTREEDRLLKKLVKKHGVRKWSQIAQMVPGRLGKQFLNFSRKSYLMAENLPRAFILLASVLPLNFGRETVVISHLMRCNDEVAVPKLWAPQVEVGSATGSDVNLELPTKSLPQVTDTYLVVNDVAKTNDEGYVKTIFALADEIEGLNNKIYQAGYDFGLQSAQVLLSHELFTMIMLCPPSVCFGEIEVEAVDEVTEVAVNGATN
ncbi:hypothetical protein LguiB_008773 [Lonicera macranthoides]